MRALLTDLRDIYRLVTDPALSMPYDPAAKRKSRVRMLADMVHWRVTRGEINRYYYCWGMDRIAGPRARDLLSYLQFRAMRDRRNQKGAAGLDYIVLMRDKYLFSLLLDSLGHPTPPLLAIGSPEGIEWLKPRRRGTLSSVAETADLDAFYKPRFGMQGTGVFRVQTAGGRLLLDGVPATVDEWAHRAALTGPSVLQQSVAQHSAMSALHPSSVNTLRVITVRDRAGTRMFTRPLARIGFGGTVIDNGEAGGIQVFVDPATGRMQGPGLMLRGGTVARHPDSGLELDGYEIPFFAQAVDMAVELHAQLPGLHTVGWDVAMTPDGPVFLEGNDNWAAGLRIGLEPNFKRDFEALCQSP